MSLCTRIYIPEYPIIFGNFRGGGVRPVRLSLNPRLETQSDNYLQFLDPQLGLHRLQSLITRLKPKLHLLQSLVPIKGLVAQTILDPELYEPRLRFIFNNYLIKGRILNEYILPQKSNLLWYPQSEITSNIFIYGNSEHVNMYLRNKVLNTKCICTLLAKYIT